MSNPNRHKTDHAHKAERGFADGGRYYEPMREESDRQRRYGTTGSSSPSGLEGVAEAQRRMRRDEESMDRWPAGRRGGGSMYDRLEGEARRQGWRKNGGKV